MDDVAKDAVALTEPTTTESDVIAGYRLILNREPNPGEGLEKQGRPWNHVFEEMLFSDEFRKRRLPDLRETVFQRFTDHYIVFLERYVSAIDRFRSGEILSARSDDHAEFLIVAYLVLLRRLPDHMGFIDYLRRLERESHDRSAIIEIMANSAEGQPRINLRKLFSSGRPDSPPEIIELTDFALKANPEAADAQPPRVLAIVSGPPRSGTTALTALLNAHPQVCITNESRVFSLPDQLRRTVLLGDASFSTIGAVDALTEIVDGHAWDVIKNVVQRLRKCRVVFDAARMEIFRAPQTGPSLVTGDKNPLYLFSESAKHMQIARAIPSAKWILIFRNPPDTLRSQLRLGIVHAKSEFCDILRRCLDSAVELLRTLGPGQCFITTHDRLFAADSGAEEAVRLSAFLELPDHDHFADFLQRQLTDPQKFSSGAVTRANRASRRELNRFFVDQNDAPAFMQLIAELGLWA